MKKKFLDGFNKLKQKLENIKDTPEEIKKKEFKSGIEFLLNEFDSANLKSKYLLDVKTINDQDYYYKSQQEEEINCSSSSYNSNSILLVAVIGFHHKKGSIIEFFHPSIDDIVRTQGEYIKENLSEDLSAEKVLDDILNQLTYFCLPDAVHTTNEDAQFFFIQNFSTPLYGVSCYRQLKTNSLEVDDQNTRNCVQKAICVVSKVPLFGQFYSKLSSTMTAFFNQNTLKDKQILEQLFLNYQSISFKNVNINEIFMSFSLRKLFMFCKEKIFGLIKLILLEKKIIVYSHVSNNVCSFILSLISLIPGNIMFNFNMGTSVKNFIKSLSAYGFPLRIYNKSSKIFPLLTLFDFSQIESIKSFLVGTTNQMMLNNNRIKYDCVVNIDTGKINFSNEIPEKILKSSKNEKLIYNFIYNKLKTNFNDKEENWMFNMNNYDPMFEGSDDFIRNEFKNYFYEFAISLSLAIQITNNTASDVINLTDFDLDISESNSITNANSNTSSDEEDESVNYKKINSHKKKEKEVLIKYKTRAVKKVLKGYNLKFLSNWLSTLNFKIWLSSHDKSLSLRSSYVKNANNVTVNYDNGDIYTGSLSKGKKNGYGVFNENSIASVYNGNWCDDMKSGSGCLTSADFKTIYDGEWKENKKNGLGQFINNKVKYSGPFKNDLYHGTGILCDAIGNIYEGDFLNGYYDGMGHFKSHTSEIYIGQFKNNLFNGKGQITSSDGSIYNGFYENGKKKGEGLLILSNGDKYEGFFLDDKFEGDGVYTFADGNFIEGKWKNGIHIGKNENV